MLSKTERLAESVIKSVLEILRSHPDTEFTELQIEQGTKEKIISKQAILDRLRNNSKIHYDSVTGRYRFKPVYPIRSKTDLLSFILSRTSLVVDSDLLECYKQINEDITDFLVDQRVRAIRQADVDRSIKCLRVESGPSFSSSVPTKAGSKCSMYSPDRCANCSNNRGLVLMKRFEKEIESMRSEEDIKEFWNSVKFPHVSEIHRLTQSQSQHLLTTSTSQIIMNKAVRKVRGSAAAANGRSTASGQRFSWSDVNANRVSNIHMLSLLAEDQSSGGGPRMKPTSIGRSLRSATVLRPSLHLDVGDEQFAKSLTKVQFQVLREARTEPRKTGLAKGGFDDHFVADGTYLCAACSTPLYTSAMKFDCGCGWPGFWTNLPNAVAERPETDGSPRTEILCSACGSHLGHLFRGEGFSNPEPNERHCVNSVSLKFKSKNGVVTECTYKGSVY